MDELGKDSKASDITVEPDAGVTELATESPEVDDPSKTVDEPGDKQGKLTSVIERTSINAEVEPLSEEVKVMTNIGIDKTVQVQNAANVQFASDSLIAVIGSDNKATIEIENTGANPTVDGEVEVVIKRESGDAELGTLSGGGTVQSGAEAGKATFSLNGIASNAKSTVEIPIQGGTKPTVFSVSLQHQGTLLPEPSTKIAWKDKKVQLAIASTSTLQVTGKKPATIMITNTGDTIDKGELVLVIERISGDAELKNAQKMKLFSYSFIDFQHGTASKKEITLWDIVDKSHKDSGWKNIRGVKIPIKGKSASEAEFKVSLQYKGTLLPEFTQTIKWSKK